MPAPEGKPTYKTGTIVKEDPVLRFSDKGTAWTRFSIKVKPRKTDENPNPEDQFYVVSAFKTLAEHVCQCFTRGDRVLVAGLGSVKSREYNGQTYTDKVIVADAIGAEVTFCGVDIHRSKTDAQPPAPQPDPRGNAQQYDAGDEPF